MTNKDVTKALAESLKKPAQKFADAEIIVIGNNNRYGIGQTLNQARKNASNPGQWIAYIVAEGTTVSEIDGTLWWKRGGSAPRVIAHSAGVKPPAKLLLSEYRPNGGEEVEG